MPTEDTDDFFTFNTHEVEETFIGCGGEFCPGPYTADNPRGENDPPECSQCRAHTKHTVRVLRSNDYWGE